VVYDLRARREHLLCGGPGLPAPIGLAAAVKASAAVPLLFQPLRAEIGGRSRWLADAGWFAAVPVEHAFAPPVRARRVIAVDLGLLVCLRQARRAYWDHLEEACGESLVVLRPRVRGTGTIVPRPGQVDRLAAAGDEALDGESLARIRRWVAAPR
jgi:predicted acylesterase/phospholipase RssA